jgi:hypothetical protein
MKRNKGDLIMKKFIENICSSIDDYYVDWLYRISLSWLVVALVTVEPVLLVLGIALNMMLIYGDYCDAIRQDF